MAGRTTKVVITIATIFLLFQQCEGLGDCAVDFTYNPLAYSIVIDYNCDFTVNINEWSANSSSNLLSLSLDYIGQLSGLKLVLEFPNGDSVSQLIESEVNILDHDITGLECLSLDTIITICTVDDSVVYYEGILRDIPSTVSLEWVTNNGTVAATLPYCLTDVDVVLNADGTAYSPCNVNASTYDFQVVTNCGLLELIDTAITIENQYESVGFIVQHTLDGTDVTFDMECLFGCSDEVILSYQIDVLTLNGDSSSYNTESSSYTVNDHVYCNVYTITPTTTAGIRTDLAVIRTASYEAASVEDLADRLILYEGAIVGSDYNLHCLDEGIVPFFPCNTEQVVVASQLVGPMIDASSYYKAWSSSLYYQHDSSTWLWTYNNLFQTSETNQDGWKPWEPAAASSYPCGSFTPTGMYAEKCDRDYPQVCLTIPE